MAVSDRDELWEVKCQYIVSLMVLRRRASRSGAGRAVRGRKLNSADGALIRLLTSNKDSGTRHSAVRATVRSGSVSWSC